MSSDKGKISRFYVGEMPLIRQIINNLHLKEILKKYIKPHKKETIPAVDSLIILLFNLTCGRQPLYEIEEWAAHIDPQIFGYESLTKGVINDDRFGRALDKLYLVDRATMMTEIIISMAKLTNLDLSQIHNDSTTIKAFGKIPGKTRTGLELANGHSKEHRPDLKQIVYTLSISADGAVPVHYKTYAGNRTDDTTHIETWNTLVKIIGTHSFLYVADSKVCTSKQLHHIVKNGGRVVTIIPETWKETQTFKDELRKKKILKQVIWRRVSPEQNELIDYFSCFTGDYKTTDSNYKIHWIYSSRKNKLDRKAREKTLKKAEYELAELSGKLNTRHLKTKEAILEKVADILDNRGIRKFFHLNLMEVLEIKKKQVGLGRPSPKTKFKTTSIKLFSIACTRNQQVLKEEKNVDGIFPLLSTDHKITAKEALIAYKYQPRLEKRFNQFRNVHNAAPLLFKKIERVEGIMFLFFISLVIQAIIEREVRKNMKDNNILTLPVYPEHRIAYHPTTAKIFDRFEGVSKYYLEKDDGIKEYHDELTALQKEIIDIFEITQNEFWSN